MLGIQNIYERWDWRRLGLIWFIELNVVGLKLVTLKKVGEIFVGLSEHLSKVGLEEVGPKIGLLELSVVGIKVVTLKEGGETFVGRSEHLSKVGLEEVGPKIGLLKITVVGLNVVTLKKVGETFLGLLVGIKIMYQRWDWRK